MTDRIEPGRKDDSAGAARGSEARTAAGETTGRVLVSGMTCAHCVSSVTEELTAVDGIESVSVDLNAGGDSLVTIRSRGPVDPAAVEAAVEEAGYRLAGAPR